MIKFLIILNLKGKQNPIPAECNLSIYVNVERVYWIRQNKGKRRAFYKKEKENSPNNNNNNDLKKHKKRNEKSVLTNTSVNNNLLNNDNNEKENVSHNEHTDIEKKNIMKEPFVPPSNRLIIQLLNELTSMYKNEKEIYKNNIPIFKKKY
ncbi:hypothetical protein PFDG_02414 [Plasmodium falciparum Dd2]|uniref:Uncharacterized protein n=1 Tax=Plasmodium falciparum (isolate Dd2) TaxID=57267 RepID=A0A0L7M1L0_PLAF4|nr:hypothetical protein PFDG_02414 [Plasmodium falciparum Dd2]